MIPYTNEETIALMSVSLITANKLQNQINELIAMQDELLKPLHEKFMEILEHGTDGTLPPLENIINHFPNGYYKTELLVALNARLASV